MRIFRITLLFMLCFALLIGSALAGKQIISLQFPEDFSGELRDVLPDGTLVVCGGIGLPMEKRPALMEIQLDGTITDVTPDADTFDGSYRDFIGLDEDSYMLVRDVPNDPEYREYVGRIDSDQISWQSKPIANLSAIDRLKDGILVTCKPQPVTAEIRKLDFDGNEVWKLRFEERMVVKGILVGDDFHVAYGMVYEDPQPDNRDQRVSSLIFAFDDAGKLLWRHDGVELSYSSDLIDAAWTGDGGVIAISSSCAYKFDANGEIWRREFDRFGNTAVITLEDGRSLVICGAHHETGMPMRIIGDDGILLKETYLSEIRLGSADPLWVGDDFYLAVSSGMKGIVQLAKLELEF